MENNKKIENAKNQLNDLKQMVYLIYRNYRDRDTQMLSIALTYYSLLAIFPIVALILGITRGFGLEKVFIQKFFEIWPGNNGMLKVIIDVAKKLLVSTEGGVLAGVGIIVLFYAASKVLITLENSFNKIWRINKKRSLARRMVDYVAIIFLGPIFFISFSAFNSYIAESIIKSFPKQKILIDLFIGISGPLTYILLFSFIFYLVPNINVKIKPAIIAGVVTTVLTFGWKLLFLLLQSTITNYNVIYGSLALIPIFLIWVQYVWVTILLGSQIAFSIQTSDEFLYNQNKEVPIKVKREAGILILSLIIKNFEEKKAPYTYQKLSDRLGMSVFLIKDILSDLEKMGFIHEMFSEKNADIQYHVAYNPTSITINQFMKEFDTKNIEYYSDVFNYLNDEDKRILEDIREKLSMKNMEEGEVKSIAESYANKEYTNPKKLNPDNQLEFEVVPNVENFIEEEENSKEKNKEKIEIVEEEVVQEEKNEENIVKEKENKENEEQKEKSKVEEKSEILESEKSSQELNDTVEKMETKEAEKEIKVIEKEEKPISKKTEEKEIKDEKVLKKAAEDITEKEDSEKVAEEKPEKNSKESSSFEIPNFEILTTVKARREQKEENSGINLKKNIDSENSENEELLFKESDDEIEEASNSDLSLNKTKKAKFVGGRWRIM
nr:YhjD/YihY/BrkB family envelope integrity protein [uncultured Leptotrichia sp.]